MVYVRRVLHADALKLSLAPLAMLSARLDVRVALLQGILVVLYRFP